jgi:hypothetical protein
VEKFGSNQPIQGIFAPPPHNPVPAGVVSGIGIADGASKREDCSGCFRTE